MVFYLLFALDFIFFIYVILFIYFYVCYNTNIMNLKLEYCYFKPRTFLL